MRCRIKKCAGVLRMSHVYEIDDKGRTSTAKCDLCGIRVTFVQFVAYDDPVRGQGAYALAKQWAAGKIKPGVSNGSG